MEIRAERNKKKIYIYIINELIRSKLGDDEYN